MITINIILSEVLYESKDRRFKVMHAYKRQNLLRQWSGGLLAGVMFVSGCAAPSNPASDNNRDALELSPSAESRPVSVHDGEEEKASFLTFEDDTGREIRLPEQPQRIIVLSPQLLDLLYSVDGHAIAHATSPGGTVPDEAERIEEVGGMTTVNKEKLLALKPDLVIGSVVFHRELTAILDASNVPFALFNLSTYADLQQKAVLFGQLSGTENKAREALADLDQEIREWTARVPASDAPTFIMLNVTPNSLSVQRQDTVGIEVATMLHMNNLAETWEAASDSPSTAPFSLEKIVELNPDYVFILIHGAREDGEKKIQSDLASQPAWTSLRAVKENRMVILPSDRFLSNPGFRLSESVEYLAKLVYPNTYENGH
ncbi:ABC transporter substrate-binding protein [Paenibacillus sp. FSL M8-0142]|uniref:ABC transporter substrate-binding protein n=1 Tax=Paenibacillus sp. FSL M8-0142 TaxID=2954525 RepID=UPI00315AB302